MSSTSTMPLLFSLFDLWIPGLALHLKVWTWAQWLLESPLWVHTALKFSLCIVFFSYLFKYFRSACNVFENGSDVITNGVTPLLKPVIPSWLRWRYWFGWDCMQIHWHQETWSFSVCLWFQSRSQVSPTHMFWLQHVCGLIPVSWAQMETIANRSSHLESLFSCAYQPQPSLFLHSSE